MGGGKSEAPAGVIGFRQSSVAAAAELRRDPNGTAGRWATAGRGAGRCGRHDEKRKVNSVLPERNELFRHLEYSKSLILNVVL